MYKVKSINNLELKDFIIHQVDNTKNSPFLTDKVNIIDEETREVLEGHIKAVITNSHLKFAKFSNDSPIFSICDEIFNDKDKFSIKSCFVEKSKEIAINLFTIMAKNKNISPGNLLVCIYSTDQGLFLSVLKMNFSKNADLTFEKNNGQNVVNVKYNESSLSHETHLHKCFIYGQTGDEYNLAVLDNQNDGIAQFFVNNFMKSTLLRTDFQRVSEFYEETNNFFENKKIFTENEKVKYQKKIPEILKTFDQIDVNKFADMVFGDKKDIKSSYETLVMNKLPELSFSVDEKWINKLERTEIIIEEDDIRIIMKNGTYIDTNKIEFIKHKTDNKYDILIKNVSYKTNKG